MRRLASFSWQNFRDDLFAHKRRIIHRSGYVFLPVGMLMLFVPTMMEASSANAKAAAIFILLGCGYIAYAVAVITHPAIASDEINYRYEVEVETNAEKLRDFLQSSGIEWTTKNYPNPITQVERFGPVDIHTTIFLTRLEDRMLLRMRF